MITADNITDEQIRELCEAANKAPKSRWFEGTGYWPEQVSLNCVYALSTTVSAARMDARTRCAEILNARGAK